MVLLASYATKCYKTVCCQNNNHFTRLESPVPEPTRAAAVWLPTRTYLKQYRCAAPRPIARCTTETVRHPPTGDEHFTRRMVRIRDGRLLSEDAPCPHDRAADTVGLVHHERRGSSTTP
eukprot:238973-Prymnesium_polylepis.1